MIDTGCDECGAPALFVAYAAYEVRTETTDDPVHTLLARYPLPMIRSCAEHIGGQMMFDSEAHASTKQWLVSCAV